MKKYIIVSLLVVSFIITPVFVSAQTSQSDQIDTLIRLLQSLVQQLQQQLSVLRMQGQSPLSSQQRTDILQNLNNPSSLFNDVALSNMMYGQFRYKGGVYESEKIVCGRANTCIDGTRNYSKIKARFKTRTETYSRTCRCLNNVNSLA